MVVGPRFIPGTTLDAAMKGTGTYHDTTRVPDASRITPPVLGKGQRSGHDISIELIADAALPVSNFSVPTHDVAVKKPADGSLRLALSGKDNIPNRDFVLRYSVAGKEPAATLLTSGDSGNGYFALMVHPPQLDIEEQVGRREIIFVVDVSGSMRGVPIGMCKQAMRKAIHKLRPVDTFNIITFAGATRKAFSTPRPANHTNISRALGFLGRARAGGGTHMENAVHDALSPSVGKGRHRYVFFLTDGYVGHEQEIISGSMHLVEAMQARGQRARVFGFGVGSSVNRNLLEGLSRAGNGVAVYATTREDPALAVNKFYRYIDRAVLTDISITWGDLGQSELFPNPIGDLFASHPIIVHGRYSQLSDEPMVLHARAGGAAPQAAGARAQDAARRPQRRRARAPVGAQQGAVPGSRELGRHGEQRAATDHGARPEVRPGHALHELRGGRRIAHGRQRRPQADHAVGRSARRGRRQRGGCAHKASAVDRRPERVPESNAPEPSGDAGTRPPTAAGGQPGDARPRPRSGAAARRGIEELRRRHGAARLGGGHGRRPQRSRLRLRHARQTAERQRPRLAVGLGPRPGGHLPPGHLRPSSARSRSAVKDAAPEAGWVMLAALHGTTTDRAYPRSRRVVDHSGGVVPTGAAPARTRAGTRARTRARARAG